MSGHIVHDFKDLRSLISAVTKANPAKTTRQQNEKKMGVYKEAPEAEPKDDKGDRGIARSLGKKHAGEDEIKQAYIKLGRAAQGSVEYQRTLVQKQLAKMGFKTYSKMAFDDLFNVEQKDVDKFISIMEGKGFDDKQLDGLRKAYGNLKKVNPTSPVGKNLLGMFKKMSKDELQSLASAGINFLSLLAVSNLIRMGVKPADIKYVKAMKEKKKKKWNEPLKGFPGNEEIDESKMGDLLIDIQQGATAKELARDHNIPLSVAKNFLKDYYGQKKGGRKESVEEGKYDKVMKAMNRMEFMRKIGAFDIDKAGDNDLINLANKLEKKRSDKKLQKQYNDMRKKKRLTPTTFEEIKEDIQEGTWAVANTKDKMKALNNMMKKALIIKGDNDAKKAVNSLGRIIGDDTVHDEWYTMSQEFRKGSAAMDARDPIVKFLEDWGFTVKNYQITHYPEVLIQTEEDIQERGNLKKPKRGKLLKLDNEPSRSKQVKEEYEKAQDSPFKLKSQQYPRAVAINTDGFGKRHATVEDIIAACDSFGMIIDKELQVEQIQKQLGKTGFITYNKSELQDVFEERETQRIILTLESTVEDQGPIEYTKEEIIEAYIMGEEIEFLKPDGLKTAGPVLKKSGNTFNVKDKFTGKSYTYKYIGEAKVKTFNQVSKAEISQKEIGEDIQEGKFSSKLIKQAGGIAFDKRYYMGNMTGAINAIEKLKKGLSDDPKVKEMLKIANEGVDEWVSKDGTRRRVKERDQRKYKKVQEWEEAAEASGDKEAYQKFFNAALKKFGVNSPDELEGDKKKEFFNYVDKNWKGDHEEVKPSDLKIDGRRKNFKEKMRKLGYIKGN